MTKIPNYIKLLTLVLYLIFGQLSAKGQAFLYNPIEGSYGKEYIIVNYVDWGIDSLLDNQCGNKTYRGHQGIDFVIRNFSAMDDGIYVLAAADGIVTYTKDTIFDREIISDTTKGLGNYIAIAHSNKYYSYYGHLKKNSALVKIGDTVKTGMRIGKVGSSGNSSDPHLHFELWYDSTLLIDPFAGPCGNQNSLWVDNIPYDTSLQIWTSGLVNYIANLDKLKQEPEQKITFNQIDTNISYWGIMYGLKKGDTLTIKWLTPKGIEWFSFNYKIEKNYWYYYYWTYIDLSTNNIFGDWTVELYRNGEAVDKIIFTINSPSSLNNDINDRNWSVFPNPNYGNFTIQSQNPSAFELIDLLGRSLEILNCDYEKIHLELDLNAGIYFLREKKTGLMQRIIVW